MAINVSGPNKDQHSGLVGGTIREPMSDLIFILSNRLDVDLYKAWSLSIVYISSFK